MPLVSTDKEIIGQFIKQLYDELKGRIPKVSGASADSLEMNTGDDFGEILGARYLPVFEKGRKPTSNSTPGNPTLRQRMLSWIKAKGIIPRADANGRIPTPEQLAFIMSRKIHRDGYPARHPGLFSQIITTSRIDAFLEVFAENKSQQVFTQVMEGFAK